MGPRHDRELTAAALDFLTRAGRLASAAVLTAACSRAPAAVARRGSIPLFTAGRSAAPGKGHP